MKKKHFRGFLSTKQLEKMRNPDSKCLTNHILRPNFDTSLLLSCPGGYAAPGANHVVYRERQREDGGDVALGMLAGAATGLALGSLFSVF